MPAGTTVKFGCETNTGSRIRWCFDSPRLQLPVVLYNGYSVISSHAGRIAVNTTARGNEITARNVGTDDSGVYSCHKVEKFSSNITFYLVVKGTLIYRTVETRNADNKQAVWPPVCPRPPLMTQIQHFVSRMKKRQRWDVQTMWACNLDFWPWNWCAMSHVPWSTCCIPNLGTLGFRVLELFTMYATDELTDRQTDGRMDGQKQSSLYLPYGRGIAHRADCKHSVIVAFTVAYFK